MTCNACDNAREHPNSGMFHNGCEGCAARSIARSPSFFIAVKEGRFTPGYRMALQQLLPKMSQAEAHAAVKEWLPRAEAKT